MTLAVLGMVCVIAGALFPGQPLQKHLFCGGSVVLTISAVLRGRPFLIALQFVMLSGTLIAYTPTASHWQAIALWMVAVPAVWWRTRAEQLNTAIDYAGVVGILVLATGYAVSHWTIYLAGDVIVLVVSWVEFRRGVREALVWVALNGLFAISVLASLVLD